MSDDIEKLKAKIAKLLNMTVENGCTEDEQESAMRMAAGLATRGGIELESIRQKEPGTAQRKAIKKAVYQEFKIHQVFAAQAASILYGCDLFLYDQGRGGLLFVGRDENVEMAEQTMFWLMRQVELLYKQSLPRGMSQRDRAEFRKTFKAACAQTVYRRAQELMRKMKQDEATAQEATGQNALIVQGYFEQLERENKEVWELSADTKARIRAREDERQRLEDARRSALTQHERDAEDRAIAVAQKKADRQAAKRKGPRARRMPVGNGTGAGRVAGNAVQLRKGVN